MLKKRIALSLALLAFFAGGAAAQTNDSLTFVNAKWNKEKVAKGIEWYQYHFTGEEKIFDAEEFVNVLVVDQKKAKRRFALTALEGKLRRTSQAALDSGAIVAINGSFYNTRPPYNSVCYLKINGEVIFERSGKMGDRDGGAVLIDDRGRVSVEQGDPDDPQWVSTRTEPSIIGSGPMMLQDGQRIDMGTGAFVTLRHPRTAIGTSGNKVYLVTVDGRSKGNSLGVNLNELANILKWLGAENALNLDGGGSTTMYIEGQPENGIVNRPCDNQKFDRQGERRVSNSLLLL
ncbi:MAG TPA: phosphodiester glycosidase family protein [Bacteroidetes bacterium]|nr:phosphodiester glycosidase family protein [Bacteroidota bacterium]